MSAPRIVAIHQPNFFPWLGYFNKIARADVFVVLDDVPHTMTGSNWSNRVKLLLGGEARWATAPVKRPAHGAVLLAEAEWADQPWRGKLVKSLALNYSKAPFFAETMALIQPLIESPEPGLVAYNVHAIRAIASAIGIHKQLVMASGFAVPSASTERLVALTRAVGCSGYMAGGGAAGYQQDELFTDAGLTVQYQYFTAPVYPQKRLDDFIGGLSIIDALMNCGVDQTGKLVCSRIKTGIQLPRAGV